jgi:hypothetical protein
MFGGMKDYGQIAATCIANSEQEAERMLQTLEDALNEEWRTATIQAM